MFKLLEIEFVNHPFFKTLPIKFADKGEENAPNYCTLIIGPNGTGKSKILLAVIEIFNSLELLRKTPEKKYSYPFSYKLKYIVNEKEHNVDYSNFNLIIDNHAYIRAIENLDLPTKILISAFNFNDKYPLSVQRGKVVNDKYHYLGLKSTTNNIFIGNPTKNAIYNLYNAFLRQKDILPLKEAFKTLDLKPELRLFYKGGKNHKLLRNDEFWEIRNLTPDIFKKLFENLLTSKKSKSYTLELKRLGAEKIEKILNDKEKILRLIHFLKGHIRELTDFKDRRIGLNPILDLEDESSFNNFISHIEPLQILSDLEIISFDRFEIKKLNTNFSFDDASSGEYHIIIAFLNILCLIEENSLVMLDEPEISLHPNWQIKYMNIFDNVFKHFPNSHFVLASHSHFLVSDLKKESSHIVALSYDSGLIKLVPIEKNTFGWSAEQILLDVFKVNTTRNYYITKTVTGVLKELAKMNPNYNSVKEQLQQIIFLDTSDFKEHDPLKEIFTELTKLYKDL